MPKRQSKSSKSPTKVPGASEPPTEVLIEEDGDSIEITVPKLKVERIKMKFGGIRIAIHDADKE